MNREDIILGSIDIVIGEVDRWRDVKR